MREANQLGASGSPDAAATILLDAVTTFVPKARAQQLVEYASAIQWSLTAAVAQQPSRAVAVFGELARSSPRCVSNEMASMMVREWARSPRLDGFQPDWAVLEGVLSARRQDALGILLHVCRSVSRGQLTGTFRRGAAAHLWTYLDRNLELAGRGGNHSPGRHAAAFQLLALVSERSLSWADQLCALGDLAHARTSPGEALGRYEAAAAGGSRPAAQRLAYHRAREGHRLLSAGDIEAARRKFGEAVRLHNDQEYVFLAVVTDLLGADADTRAVLGRLHGLDPVAAPARYLMFWRAVAHLRGGEEDEARQVLHTLARQPEPADQGWGPGDEAAVLLAVLERNDQDLVNRARLLVQARGSRWLSAGPSDPWPMVGAVARHDRALLAELVSLIDDPAALPDWVRVAGAHALLARSAAAARQGVTSTVDADLGHAERMLSR